MFPFNSTSPALSSPVPLGTYSSSSSSASTSAAGSSSLPFAFQPPFLTRNASTSSTVSSYHDAFAPSPLSSSSLEQTVYRGVMSHAEPTEFAAPNGAAASLWHSHTQPTPFAFQQQQPAKKLEFIDASYQTPLHYNASPYLAAPSVQHQPLIELPAVPSHVERFTSFYSSAVPAVIAKSLRIGFQTISDLKVEFSEEVSKGKSTDPSVIASSMLIDVDQFRGEVFTEDNESIQFIARVYKCGSAAPAAHLIEFQRRCGDSVSFFRFFQKMLKSCQAIHHGPYEASFSVAGMNLAPLSHLTPLAFSTQAPALPNMQAIRLDAQCVGNLCNMVNSDCIETQREVSKCLANVSSTTDLFPPMLERQGSAQQAAQVASKAIWNAVVSILTSGDAECARMGVTILRNCIARGEQALLVEHLEADRTLLPHLVSRLAADVNADSTADVFAQREIRRQVAAVIQSLVQKKGAAYLHARAPNALMVLQQYQSQQ